MFVDYRTAHPDDRGPESMPLFERLSSLDLALLPLLRHEAERAALARGIAHVEAYLIALESGQILPPAPGDQIIPDSAPQHLVALELSASSGIPVYLDDTRAPGEYHPRYTTPRAPRTPKENA